MNTKFEQCLAIACAVSLFAILIDAAVRGIGSLYGRFFVWLCATL